MFLNNANGEPLGAHCDNRVVNAAEAPVVVVVVVVVLLLEDDFELDDELEDDELDFDDELELDVVAFDHSSGCCRYYNIYCIIFPISVPITKMRMT